jgi:mono/diheme cytochrome c family protein
MKRILLRFALVVLPILASGATALAVAVAAREDRTFDRPYPEIQASRDPAVVERGRYLATGPAHCVDCHGEDLSGGIAWNLPVGTFRAPNITPDRETGAGRYRDEELARALREGVHPSGRAMLPFMPFANLTDADLTAVLSYIRSVPAVRKEVQDEDLTWLGRFFRAFLLEPTGPRGEVPPALPPEPTVAYGEYLVNDVANCVGCHTQRDLRSGEYIGPKLAGGMTVETHGDTPLSFITPNLTPDPETGRITAWSEDVFVARFKNAPPSPSAMPWETFRRMTDEDLRALYRYLRTLPPVRTPEGL